MTDREAIIAGHRAVLAARVGNIGLARYLSSVEVVWRRTDALGQHAELRWSPAQESAEHLLVTDGAGRPVAFRAS